MTLLKNIFLMLFLASSLFGSHVHAQNSAETDRNARITKTQANQFYEACLDQSYPANSTESKKLFCSCSSARLYEQLRNGDVQDLRFPETWQGIRAKNNLLQYVYTPCIKDTLDDLIREECDQNKTLDEYKHISKTVYCACQTTRMNLVFEQSFGEIAAENKKDVDKSLADPIASFMNNSVYQDLSAQITNICMKQATIKIEPQKPIETFVAPLVDTVQDDAGDGAGSDTKPDNTKTDVATVEENEESNENEPEVTEVEVTKADLSQCTPLPYEEAYKLENIGK